MWRVREWLLVFSLRRWLYSWRRSRHVAGPPILYLPATMYGSMDLDAERALGTHLPAYLAAPLDPLPGWGTVASGWREQTAAELSPQALEATFLCPACVMDDHCDGASDDCDCTCGWPEDWAEADDDSGPGVPSLTPPGPDPYPLPAVFSERYDPPPSIEFDGPWGPLPTRLADTADITDARLLADVQADMRAREDGCLAFLAGFASACERVRLDLSASLA